ncbi:YcnI family protein [Subtercola sp. PAMC28395]|uniref:YcnI family copper-binding membrane protein n=1 Tax=Subtercola sp. PAMC28395 TaxID=2846775 RepID=UPI001C0D530C|nr:YcnI family protein [Subtercola sp. PAMC28395]QWT23963.1 YcnI family protein [Subtercola sp. PAMC28395]
MNSTAIRRAGLAVSLTAFLALAAPLAASAHVHVDPGQATAGEYSTLTFTVPNESATASTTKLEIDLPTDTPFGSVSYQPVPGWSAEVVQSTLATPVKTDDGTVTEAPTKITWTAGAGAGIAPGQYQLFAISVGPIPSTGSILLPTHQTYSDGTVSDWVNPTPASGIEPEDPAPTLYVNDPAPVEAGATGATVSATPSAGPAASPAESNSGSAALAVGLGLGALALGAVALVISVLAFTRRRGTPTN